MRFSLLLLIGTLLILQFQNCVPNQEQQFTNSCDGEPPPISTIDDVNMNTKVEFEMSELWMDFKTETFDVSGICSKDQDGAFLAWNILSSTDEKIDSGHSVCENGIFTVQLNNLQDLECDENFQLKARLGLGEEGTIVIGRECPLQ